MFFVKSGELKCGAWILVATSEYLNVFLICWLRWAVDMMASRARMLIGARRATMFTSRVAWYLHDQYLPYDRKKPCLYRCGTFFYFPKYMRYSNPSQWRTHIYQDGWNHQPDIHYIKWLKPSIISSCIKRFQAMERARDPRWWFSHYIHSCSKLLFNFNHFFTIIFIYHS